MIISKFKHFARLAFSKKYLLYTNTCLTSSLLTLGDCIQQNFQMQWHEEPEYNVARTVRVGLAGLVLGPMSHFWYGWLDGYLPGNTLRIVLKKIAFDQSSCPAFSFAFIATVGLLEGGHIENITREYVRKFLFISALDWLVWPPTQIINFLFLPPRFRVLYVCCVQLFYYTCLSYLKHEFHV